MNILALYVILRPRSGAMQAVATVLEGPFDSSLPFSSALFWAAPLFSDLEKPGRCAEPTTNHRWQNTVVLSQTVLNLFSFISCGEENMDDALGMLADASKRFEVDDVQWVAELHPENIPRGGRLLVRVFAQNTLDVPIFMKLQTRALDGDLAAHSTLSRPVECSIEMTPGECSEFSLPIETRNTLSPGKHKLSVRLEGNPESRGGGRVVPKKGVGEGNEACALALGLGGRSPQKFKTSYMREAKFVFAATEQEKKTAGKTANWYQKQYWNLDDSRNIEKASAYVDKYFAQLTSDKMAAEMLEAIESSVEKGMDFMAVPMLEGEKRWMARWLIHFSHQHLSHGDNARGLLILGTLGCLRDGGKPAGSQIAVNLADMGFHRLLSGGAEMAFSAQNKKYGREIWTDQEKERLLASLNVGGDLRDQLTIIWKL
ncbi:MAG: hypothetical protein QCI38_02305, partial [Candidatus Thermoplasmatota archaeon]|nr:hypothetical protein [Candidatus Thermoplasmatota archaeon]